MQTSPRFHSTPHVHFSQIHASFDLGGRKLKSGIKSGAAARRESNQTANREASAPIRDRSKFGGRWDLPRSCPGAVAVRWQPSRSCRRSIAVRWEFLGSCPRAIAVRWEPPHSCGGGALERSEKTPPFKMRFSAGHFRANPLSNPKRKRGLSNPISKSRNHRRMDPKSPNLSVRNLFRLERTPILCFVELT